MVEKSKDILANERITIEKEFVQKLLNSIAKNDNLSVYGENAVRKELENENVDTLLISSGLNEEKKNEFYYLGKEKNIDVEIISKDSSDGLQLFNLGGLAAFLRRPSKQ